MLIVHMQKMRSFPAVSPFLALMFFFGFTGLLSAQQNFDLRLENWQTHSSMLSCRGAAMAADGSIWGGTSGGVFAYDPDADTYTEFRNIEALSGLDVTALKINPANNEVFSGTLDGFVDIYDSETWVPVREINDKADQFPSVQINDFAFRDDIVFIAGDFGLSIYDRPRDAILSTVTNFGNLNGIRINAVVVEDNTLWCATSDGIVSAELTEDFFLLPQNPENWTVYGFDEVDPDKAAPAISSYAGAIYTVNRNILWRLEFDSFVPVDTVDSAMVGLSVYKGDLLYATNKELHRFGSGFIYTRPSSVGEITGLTTVSNGNSSRLAICTQTGGLGLWNDSGGSVNYVAPNSPQGNVFGDIAIGSNGDVWCASSASAGSGMYRLREGTWTNLNRFTFPELGTDNYLRIEVSSDGSIWGSSFGSGVALMQEDGDSFAIQRFDTTGTPLVGFDLKNNFVLVGDIEEDSRGTMWIRNIESPLVVAYDQNGDFYSYRNPGNRSMKHRYMAIDASGTKWIGGENEQGLFYFNDRRTLDDPSDDIWGDLTSAETPFTEDSQTALAVDNIDQLWVGTNLNLYVIANPFAIFSSGTPRLFIRAISDLAGNPITCISVDALNNKWVGTRLGVWILNEDGTEVFGPITRENSPLVSNDITSIGIDDNSGRVYIGTSAGMSVVQTLAIRSNSDFSAMRCFPQPFNPAMDEELVIDGLAEQSQVKVITLDGTLVRDLNPLNSRTVLWDGRNEQGELVNSGVYLISAFSEPSGESSVVKAMVLRRK